MSQYDNEIYRGPPESGPTLAQDAPSYGTDFYLVKPPQTTVEQDVPPTEESILQESNLAPKKESRIGMAMKLLASCAATVAVMTSLAAPAAPAEPVPELPLWPQFLPSTYSYTYDWISQNSVDCQVSNFYKSYRLTAQQEGIYLDWERGFYTYFNVNVAMRMPTEDWDMYLYFDTDPTSIEDIKAEYSDMYSYFSPTFGTGQIQTVSGETLYVLGMLWYGQTEKEQPPAQQIIDNLDAYIQISDATTDGWDKVLIGDTMYLEIVPYWTGTIGYEADEFGWFCLEAICSTADAPYFEDALICQRRVNGIDWRFYYGDDVYGERLIWAVPAQEDIALGYDYIIGGHNLKAQEEMYNTGSLYAYIIENYGGVVRETWQDMLAYAVDNVIIEYIINNYYLVEQIPEHKPADNPTDATQAPSTETTVDAPEATTQPATEATTQPATEATTQATTEVTEPPLTKVVESSFGSDGGFRIIDYYDQQGTPVKQEYTTYDNQGNVLSKDVYDYYYRYRILKTKEQFTYYENGYLRTYDISYYERPDSNYIGSEIVESYRKEYDESGTLIDTDHNVFDWETGLCTLEDSVGSVGVTFENSDKSWLVDHYADGIFTISNQHLSSRLVEGVYYETFRETGNLWEYHQKNADGSAIHISYYTDGSLQQSAVITIDEATNTWINITEYHPVPSDDFCYRTEDRVKFDDGGNIVEYYSNQTNGNIIEIPFDRMEQSKVEYGEAGRVVRREYTGEDYVFIAHYDCWGRLERVGIRTTHYG